jgi:hypothetical protein
VTYKDRDRVVRWLEAGNGEKLTLLDRVILRDLAEAANNITGHAWLGEATLSSRWGVSTRAVQLAIARLHKQGLLSTAERGRGRRRARYMLASGFNSPNEASGYVDTNSPNQGSQQPEPGFAIARTLVPNSPNEGSGVSVVITEESLNHPQEGGRADGADAPPPPPATMDGSGKESNPTPAWAIEADLIKAAAAGDRWEITNLVAGELDLLQEISDRLGMDQFEAEEWVVDTLEGQQIHTSVRKYLRACMKNYTPPSPSTASRNGGASPPKPMEQCFECGRPIKRGQEIRMDEKRWGCQDCLGPAWMAVEKIAAILGCEPIYEDDGIEIQFKHDRSWLGMWTSFTPGLVTVELTGVWPGDKWPDEPFRGRTVHVRDEQDPDVREYRPDDAIAIAEAWRDALASTNEEIT